MAFVITVGPFRLRTLGSWAVPGPVGSTRKTVCAETERGWGREGAEKGLLVVPRAQRLSYWAVGSSPGAEFRPQSKGEEWPGPGAPAWTLCLRGTLSGCQRGTWISAVARVCHLPAGLLAAGTDRVWLHGT